jgi:hypothetical protein
LSATVLQLSATVLQLSATVLQLSATVQLSANVWKNMSSIKESR